MSHLSHLKSTIVHRTRGSIILCIDAIYLLIYLECATSPSQTFTRFGYITHVEFP